ncbi:MAG: ABC transporter ATP-binding protein [Limnochordaceae bacterium]|nr:ABC transporter ATP-binding protein [Limnochordaceae bacterium]
MSSAGVAASAAASSPQSQPQLQQQRAPARRSQLALWRDISRLLKEFWLAQPLASSALLLLMLVGNARTGLYVIAMRGLVDSLTSAAGVGEGHRPIYWLMLYVLAAAIEEVYWVVQPTLQAYLGDHGSYRIQATVLRRAAAVPLVRFDEPVFFDQLQRANAGMGQRLVGLYTNIADFLRGFVMLASVAVSLYVVHPLLLPLLVAGSLPTVWFQARISSALYELQRSHTTRDRVRGYLQWLLTAKDAASELRLFGLSDYLLGRWHDLRAERRRDVLATEGKRSLYTTAGSAIAAATYAGGLVLIAVLIFRGQLSIGDYVAVTTGALWFQGMVGSAIVGVRSLAEEALFLGDLFEYMRVTESPAPAQSSIGRPGMVSTSETPAAHMPPAEAASVDMSTTKPASFGLQVDAEAISFRYPGNAEAVVHDVTLQIRAGERVAIVGENGAGKTTLVKLLIGLYQPETGVVRVNGEPLVGKHAATVQRRVAAVFQDYASYALTARENIGFGDLRRINDDAALARAAEQAGIREMIESWPDRYDTYLGRQFGNTDLSGGQWQKVALARAFVRDADLVVLDEPTAAMDPLAELALFERFIDLVGHRTAIMISHRLGAARLADRVIVLRGGTVVEVGGHDELIARKGEYARLFEAQAQWYR